MPPSPRSITRYSFVAALLAGSLALGGCPKPYALAVDDIDASGREEGALIQFSRPQVYTRATLLDDRFREERHLEKMLDESDELEFLPQLVRDVTTLSALSSQLGVRFDPAAALGFEAGVADFERKSQIADLSTQIEVVKLEAQLAKLQQELAKPEQGEAGDIPDPTTNTSAPPAPPFTATGPSTDSVKTELTALLAATRATLDQLKDANTGLPRRSQVTAAPEDHYEDLSAYRARLRADLAANNLDDAHDLDGNTLFRFQFDALLLPGKKKAKWGVAALSIQSPEVKPDEVRELYYTWLGHVNYRLNRRTGLAGSDLRSDLIFQRMGADAGLFDVVERKVGRYTLRFATAPGAGCALKSVLDAASGADASVDLCAAGDADKLSGATSHLNLVPSFEAIVAGIEGRQLLDFPDDGVTSYLSRLTSAFDQRSVEARRTFDAAKSGNAKCQTRLAAQGQALDSRRELRAAQRAVQEAASDEAFDRKYKLAQAAAKADYEKARALAETEICSASEQIGILAGRSVPPIFAYHVLSADGARWAGETHTYSAVPVEKAQRLSTVASAAHSAQAALALAATVPQAGIGADLGVGYARSAAGSVDALERTPLIVGFSSAAGQSHDPDHDFGWVFGPEVSLNAKEGRLELRQRVSSHRVITDVSIPVWWPRAKIQARTAWVGRWQGGARIMEPRAPGQTILVELPRNRADLDSLTDYLEAKIFKQVLRQARIDTVFPGSIGCRKNIELLVWGVDLWRDPHVYLLGRELKNVRILPDMTGLVVTVDQGDLPSPRAANQESIVVTTRTGTAGAPIQIEDSKVCAPPKQSGSMSPKVPRAVNGSAFVLDVKAPLAAAFQYQVGLKPVDGSLRLGFAWIDASYSGGKISVPKLTNANVDAVFAKAGEGGFVEVAVRTRDEPAGAWTVHPVSPPIAVYPDVNGTKLAVTPKQKMSIPGNATIELPKSITRAYPALGRANVWQDLLRVTEGGSNVFRVMGQSLANDVVTVAIDRPVGMTDAALKALAKKKLKFSFDPEKSKGLDLPTFSTDEIELK